MGELVQLLPWDSDFFGIPIGRVLAWRLDNQIVETLLEEAHANHLRCLYFEASPNDLTTVVTAEQHGFHLVDVRVVLEHPFYDRPVPTPTFPLSPELTINSPHEMELDRLQAISMQIGYTSRFNFDEHFTPGDCERLYRLWIKNACKGFADLVLVARWSPEGEAVGLITCTLRDGLGQIQLAGVHTDHRKRGVGTGLVQAALQWSKEKGACGMNVVTQARNVAAQRLYQQMGFFTKSMTLYYHKWL